MEINRYGHSQIMGHKGNRRKFIKKQQQKPLFINTKTLIQTVSR